MIRLIQRPWSEQAAEVLRPALLGAEEEIRLCVERGKSDLWEVPGYGWCVTRIDEGEDGRRELVIVAGAGRGYLDILQCWQGWATQHGLPIRIHTHRKGIVRMAGRLGFQPVETVLKWGPHEPQQQ